VKIFIWKALHGIVPGYALLANRHVPVSGQCQICAEGAEDIRHILLCCNGAKEVWQALGLKETIETFLVDRSGSVILEEILRGDI
jgi:hypothetical protein